MKHYALYYYDSCPYCQRVLATINSVNVEVELRNVLDDARHSKEQRAATGRTTVPCLRIQDATLGEDHWMYESGDIMRYLKSL